MVTKFGLCKSKQYVECLNHCQLYIEHALQWNVLLGCPCVPQVAADTQCVLSGYLQLKTNKSWVRRWFLLHPDFVLYSYRAHTDQHAMTATPIPGYTIEKVRNAQHSADGVSQLFFVCGSVIKVYSFTESLFVRYTEASCGVFTAL